MAMGLWQGLELDAEGNHHTGWREETFGRETFPRRDARCSRDLLRDVLVSNLRFTRYAQSYSTGH